MSPTEFVHDALLLLVYALLGLAAGAAVTFDLIHGLLPGIP